MNKAIVAAVLVLALAATADTIRSRAPEQGSAGTAGSRSDARVVHPQSSSGFTAAGQVTHTRVLHTGRQYLRAAQVSRAFPVQLHGAAFDIAHLGVRADGTLVLAIYAFPLGGPAADGIEIWRGGRLVSSFLVPLGSFGGGVGFSADGKLVATLSGDGRRVLLFTPDGRSAGRESATSW